MNLSNLPSHIIDRLVAIPHVFLISNLTGEYIIKQNGIVADLSEVKLRPLIKYRLRNGFLQHERKEVQYINNYLPSNFDVIDLGAGIGFTACAAATKLEKGHKTIAVEAREDLQVSITRNAELNNVSITPIQAVYSPSTDTIDFPVERDYRSASVYENSNTVSKEVKTISLFDIYKQYGLDEFTLISDIEGSEADLLQEIDFLADRCRMIIVEMHPEKNPEVLDLIDELESLGFEFVDGSGEVKVYRNTLVGSGESLNGTRTNRQN